jgi:preprotein translocase subunit YajC
VTFVVLGQETTSSGLASLAFLALIIGVFYLLIIRPQRKRAKAQQELSSSLKSGDEVRTVGGIHGTVIAADDDSVVLKGEEGRIRVSRRAIGARIGDEG